MTIGQYIEAVEAKSLLYPQTLTSYLRALRKIAGDITGRASREKRDAIILRSLTPEKIEAWRTDFIRHKAVDRVKDIVEIPDPVPFAGIKAETDCAPRYRITVDFAPLIERAREELPSEQLKVFLLAAFVGLRRHEIDLPPWVPWVGKKA